MELEKFNPYVQSVIKWLAKHPRVLDTKLIPDNFGPGHEVSQHLIGNLLNIDSLVIDESLYGSLLLNEGVKMLGDNGKNSANYYFNFIEKGSGEKYEGKGIFGFNYNDDFAMLIILEKHGKRGKCGMCPDGPGKILKDIKEVHLGRLKQYGDGDFEFKSDVFISKGHDGEYSIERDIRG